MLLSVYRSKLEIAIEMANLISKAYEQFDTVVAGKPWSPQASGIIKSSLALDDKNLVEYKIIDIYESKFEDLYYKSKNKFLGIFGAKTPQVVNIPFGFIVTRESNIYVIFRGTRTPLEWFENGEIKQVSCWKGWGNTTFGFKSIYAELSAKVINALKKLYQSQPSSKVFVTGHSLGGALANVCVPDIVSNTDFKNPILYTFASPRAGDSQFAQTFREKNIEGFRIANSEDIVPNLPLPTSQLEKDPFGLAGSLISLSLKSTLGFISNYEIFEHVGESIYFTDQRGTIGDNHNLQDTYRNGINNMLLKLKAD